MRRLALLLAVLLGLPRLSMALAFPSAEGWGAGASGGRGGTVCKVTTLVNSGAGSLRACLEASGTRTIVFSTGGKIILTASINNIPNNVTIACQTAPGDGMLITGNGFQGAAINFVNTLNVIMRHCRIRPGEVNPDTVNDTGQTNALAGGSGVTTETSLIFDHISAGTSNDDIVGFFSNRAGTHNYNVTVQWSLFSESLQHQSATPPELTQKGIIGYGRAARMSWLHNGVVDTYKRAPLGTPHYNQIVNNVFQGQRVEITYNSQNTFVVTPTLWNVVNNYYKPFATTQRPVLLSTGCNPNGVAPLACNPTDEAASNYYLNGNVHINLRPDAGSGSDTALVEVRGTPSWTVQTSTLNPGFPTISSQTTAVQARLDVIARAGARVPRVDATDQRALANIQAGTEHLCGNNGTFTEAQCMAFGTYAAGTAPLDTDGDGIPDAWETSHGLNPASAADGATITASGYSNLELYLNELAGDGANIVAAVIPNTAANTIVITISNPGTAPMLPASGATGFTQTGESLTVTSCARTTNTIFTCTLSGSATAGQAHTLTYAPGNVTDSSTPARALTAVSGFVVTNQVSAPPTAPVLTLVHSRVFRPNFPEGEGFFGATDGVGTGSIGRLVTLRFAVGISTAALVTPTSFLPECTENSDGVTGFYDLAATFGSHNLRLASDNTYIKGFQVANVLALNGRTFKPGGVVITDDTTDFPLQTAAVGGQLEYQVIVEADTDVTELSTFTCRLRRGDGGVITQTSPARIKFLNPVALR